MRQISKREGIRDWNHKKGKEAEGKGHKREGRGTSNGKRDGEEKMSE